MSDRKVSPVRIRTKDEVEDSLAADWLPMTAGGKTSHFAASIGAGESNYKVVSRVLARTGLPEAHTVLNSLVVDPGALFNTLLLWNVVAVAVETSPVDDMAVILGMMHAATEHLERMKDGHRCHVDTAALAKLFRPLVPQMLAIIREANGGDKAEMREGV